MFILTLVHSNIIALIIMNVVDVVIIIIVFINLIIIFLIINVNGTNSSYFSISVSLVMHLLLFL